MSIRGYRGVKWTSISATAAGNKNYFRVKREYSGGVDAWGVFPQRKIRTFIS